MIRKLATALALPALLAPLALAQTGSQLNYQKWSNAAGNLLPAGGIATLTSHAAYPHTATTTGTITTAVVPQPVPQQPNSGARVWGWIKIDGTAAAPAGAYQFALIADDHAEFWISSDDTYEKKQLNIATNLTTTFSTGAPTVHLIPGRYYYIEALMKNNGGGEALNIGWKIPGGTTTATIPPAFLFTGVTPNPAKIGIGTNMPKAAFEVKGDIRTTGKVITGTLITTSWQAVQTIPDYVFAPDYKLRSISEVESFVKNNGHLPEVPSAKELHQNGMDVTAMNLHLLKKVEELTLYVIDQNRRIGELEKDLAGAKAK